MLDKTTRDVSLNIIRKMAETNIFSDAESDNEIDDNNDTDNTKISVVNNGILDDYEKINNDDDWEEVNLNENIVNLLK
mgnify:CR=1 FL=1|jgi:hypothetical protein